MQESSSAREPVSGLGNDRLAVVCTFASRDFQSGREQILL